MDLTSLVFLCLNLLLTFLVDLHAYVLEVLMALRTLMTLLELSVNGRELLQDGLIECIGMWNRLWVYGRKISLLKEFEEHLIVDLDLR